MISEMSFAQQNRWKSKTLLVLTKCVEDDTREPAAYDDKKKKDGISIMKDCLKLNFLNEKNS